MVTELRRRLNQPVDGASMDALRVGFGLLMAAAALRFMLKGWVQQLYVAPSYHFGWPGLQWLTPWSEAALYGHFALLFVAALGIAWGRWHRLWAASFFVGFTLVELWDRSYYLNHYYLITLVAGLLALVPMTPGKPVARWVPLLFRAQLAMVYFHAGLAKLGADWLLRGEPLATWLQVHAELPLLGPLLVLPQAALAMSWLGFLFDLTIAGWLLWPRTRLWAYGVAVFFHFATAMLFPIGIFPWVMMLLGSVFLAHDWPRRLRPSAPALVATGRPRWTASPLRPTVTALLGAYLLVQVLLPLRHHLHAGDVNWTEDGFRFAWRVMLIEKTASLELRVEDPGTGLRRVVDPASELSPLQLAMMRTQPDMIAQYARHLAKRYRQQGHTQVRVHADVWASLNGQPARRLIDPAADLARSGPGLGSADYVLRY